MFNSDELKKCQKKCQEIQKESKNDSMRNRDRYPYSDKSGYTFEKADATLYELCTKSEKKEKV